jgi:pimeloyl-ACP methyl ester carboxylesterase
MKRASMVLNKEIIQGDTIEYWDNKQYDKPAILLIHGFGATTKYQWFKQVKILEKDYRVVIPNLFHFGNSKPGSDKFKIQDQVDMLQNLLGHLEIERYVVCGVSYGGLIAIELANQNKEKLDKMIIFDTPVKYIYETDIAAVCKTFNSENLHDIFAPSDAKGLKKLIYITTGKYSYLPANSLREMHKVHYLSNLDDKRALITSILGEIKVYANREYEINAPTLIIWGSNDELFPAERGKMLSDYIGVNAEFHVIKNGAHMPNVIKAKQFNKLFLEFLER